MNAYYLFSKRVLERNVKEVKRAYEEAGVDLSLSYSFKTNSHYEVLQEIRRNEVYAEVVSKDEYCKALSIGYKSSEIIYNGVIPDTHGKCLLLVNGGIVNVDNYDELVEIDDYIGKMKNQLVIRRNSVFPIGLRLNIDVGNGINSRFGIEYKSEDYYKCLDFLGLSTNLVLKGIHNHAYGTRDLVYYKPRVDMMASIGKILGVRYIDLGSGMYGFMDERLVEWFGGNIPTFDDYASVTAEALAREFPDGNAPKIILELGTPLIANAIKLRAHVTNIKTIRGQKFVTLDCSMFDLGFTNRKANPPMDVSHASNKKISLQGVDLLGYSCMESDIVYRGFTGELSVGDTLTFANCGAYTIALENHFINEPLELKVVR